MKERPILMTPENAQKCHDGTKTQTRRIVSVPSWASDEDMLKLAIQRPATGIAYFVDGMAVRRLTCPYGVVGDRLWIREAHRIIVLENEQELIDYKGGPVKRMRDILDMSSWLPSIHMRREHCRTVLEITGVRVERLKDITEEDAKAEGCKPHPPSGLDGRVYRRPFECLWESIHGKGSWELNPWVWVLELRMVKKYMKSIDGLQADLHPDFVCGYMQAGHEFMALLDQRRK